MIVAPSTGSKKWSWSNRSKGPSTIESRKCPGGSQSLLITYSGPSSPGQRAELESAHADVRELRGREPRGLSLLRQLRRAARRDGAGAAQDRDAALLRRQRIDRAR